MAKTLKSLKKAVSSLEKKVAKAEKSVGYYTKMIKSASKKGDTFMLEIYQEDLAKAALNLKEAKEELEEANKALEEMENKEVCFFNDLPGCMKETMNLLIEEWNKEDKEHQEELKKQKKNDALEQEKLFEKYEETEDAEERKVAYSKYKEFRIYYSKMWNDSKLRFMELTESQLNDKNTQEAKDYIMDLVARLKGIVGTITDASELYRTGVALNGVVCGDEGKAKVETILAGGWNIQRLHCRTLVHKM